MELCLDSLYPFVNSWDYFIEPSAGNGIFLDCLKYSRKIGYDISPDRNDIIQADWMTIIPNNHDNVIFGNPPFGKRGFLIKSFIKHAIPFANVIGFILPQTYRKENKQKVFPSEWKLLSDITLPERSFTLDGRDYHVPCCFQVWGIGFSDYDWRASNQPKLSTSDFEFVMKERATHFIFGAAPHKIIEKSLVNDSNRGYYILCKNEQVVERLVGIDWKSYALSGVPGEVAWFTKQMIIDVYVGEKLKISEA